MLYRHCVAKGVHPFFLKLRSRGDVYQHLKSFRDFQSLSLEEIRVRQWKLLQDTLVHAGNNTPFFISLFKSLGLKPEDIQSLEDFHRLPILSKTEYKAADEKDLVDPVLFNQPGVVKKSTSGTSGVPFAFYQDNHYYNRFLARYLRNNEWVDHYPGDKHLFLWGEHKIPLLRGELYQYLTLRQRKLSCFPMEEEQMVSHAQFIRKFKPHTLEAYASAIYKLAKFLKDSGQTLPAVGRIITGAEALFDYQRETIQEVFGCKVFDRYGAREASSIAHECSKQKMHINADSYYVEIIDENGRPLEEGEGKVVITSFDNRVMPLIRYEIGDYARISKSVCHCGINLPTLDEVIGRATEYIRSVSGKLIPHLTFNYFFEGYGDFFKEYQVLQETLEELIIKVVPTLSFNPEKEQKMTQELSQLLDHEFLIRTEKVDAIPVGGNQKRKLVYSKLGRV